jgi:hypothetical protein
MIVCLKWQLGHLATVLIALLFIDMATPLPVPEVFCADVPWYSGWLIYLPAGCVICFCSKCFGRW